MLMVAFFTAVPASAQVPVAPEELITTSGAVDEAAKRFQVIEAHEAPVPKGDAGDALPPLARFRIGSERFVHPGPGTELALSPDGSLLVSWGAGSIVGWDAATGLKKWEEKFQGDWDSLYGTRALAITSDSRWVYSQSEPHELLRWDANTGAAQRLEVEHTLPLTAENRPASLLPGSTRSVDTTQGGDRIATAGAHGVVVYDSKGIRQLEIPNSPSKPVAAADWKEDPWLFSGHYGAAIFSPDGRTLAVILSQSPNLVSLFDASTGKELKKFELSSRVVRTAFSPDGTSLAITERNSTVSQFAIDSGECEWTRRLTAQNELGPMLAAVQYTPDGKQVIVAGSVIHVLQADDGSVLVDLDSRSGLTRSLAVPNDSALLYAIADTGAIARWDLQSFHLLSPQLGVQGPNVFATASASERFAFVDTQGELRLSSTASMPSFADEDKQASIPSAIIQKLVMSRSGQQLAAGLKSGDEFRVRLWATDSGNFRETKSFAVAKTTHEKSSELKFFELSPDGKLLAIAIEGRDEVMLWKTATGELVATVEHKGLNCLAFSRESNVIFTGGSYDTLKQWDCTNGNLLKMKAIEGGTLQNVACSPTDSLIVTAHFPNVLRYWTASDLTLKKRTALSGETNFAALDFSTNGNLLATTTSGYLIVIDTSTGSVIWKNALHPSGKVMKVGFSTDDKRLLSIGRDGIAYCWDLLPDVRNSSEHFESIWTALREESEADTNEMLWQLVQIGDPAVDSIAAELDAVERVINIKAITRGMEISAARHRQNLAYQLCEKDTKVEIDSRVRLGLKFLVLLRTTNAVALLKRLAAEHNCQEIRKEAMFALETIK